MFQVGGFGVCSLQELLRLASLHWRLKNPVTHSSLSQIRNLCQSRTQCYVLMELVKYELDSVINAKLSLCLDWTCRICMLLTAIETLDNLMVLSCMKTQYLDIVTVHLFGALYL